MVDARNNPNLHDYKFEYFKNKTMLESEVKNNEKTYSFLEAFDKIQYKEYAEMVTIDEDMIMFLGDDGLMTIDGGETRGKAILETEWKRVWYEDREESVIQNDY